MLKLDFDADTGQYTLREETKASANILHVDETAGTKSAPLPVVVWVEVDNVALLVSKRRHESKKQWAWDRYLKDTEKP